VQLTASRDHRSSSTKYVHLSFLKSRLYLVTKRTSSRALLLPSAPIAWREGLALVIPECRVHSPAPSSGIPDLHRGRARQVRRDQRKIATQRKINITAKHASLAARSASADRFRSRRETSSDRSESICKLFRSRATVSMESGRRRNAYLLSPLPLPSVVCTLKGFCPFGESGI